MKRRTVEIVTGLITVVIGAIWWVTGDGTWEPIIVTIPAILLLLYGIFFERSERDESSKMIKMKQKGGDKSSNIQVGGNYTVHKVDKDAEPEA